MLQDRQETSERRNQNLKRKSQMAKRRVHDYFLLVIIVGIGQALEALIPIPDKPFWLLYRSGALIDALTAILVYSLAYRRYSIIPFIILCLLSLSLVVHLHGYSLELTYMLLGYEEIAQVHDMYTPVLRAIMCLKMAVLGIGGYGVYRYSRDSRSRDFTPGIVVSPYYDHKISMGRMEKD